MIEKYIATFFSHFGAIRFQREIRAYGIKGIVKPVPRSLSSSCGTCVEFEIDMQAREKLSITDTVISFKDNMIYVNDRHNEIEKVVAVLEDGYREVYNSEIE